MKIKLSTLLLMGLTILLIGSIFASNYILKNEYLIVSKQKDFPYTELSNQPFKHLKLIQDQNPDKSESSGLLLFETSDTFSVMSLPTVWYIGGNDTITSKIVDDTLIISLSHFKEANYASSADFNLRIKAPKIESITCVNSNILTANLIPDSIHLSLFGNSIFSFGKKVEKLNSFEVNLYDESVLRLNNVLTINTLNVDMRHKSKLSMLNTQVQNLKFKADDSTLIEAPNTFFKFK